MHKRVLLHSFEIKIGSDCKVQGCVLYIKAIDMFTNDSDSNQKLDIGNTHKEIAIWQRDEEMSSIRSLLKVCDPDHRNTPHSSSV